MLKLLIKDLLRDGGDRTYSGAEIAQALCIRAGREVEIIAALMSLEKDGLIICKGGVRLYSNPDDTHCSVRVPTWRWVGDEG